MILFFGGATHALGLTNSKTGNNPEYVYKWYLFYTTIMPLTPTSQLPLICTAINQTAITVLGYLWAKCWHFSIITVANWMAVQVLPIFQSSLHCSFHLLGFTYLITFQWWQQHTCYQGSICAVSYSNCMCYWGLEQPSGLKGKKRKKEKRDSKLKKEKWEKKKCKNISSWTEFFIFFFFPQK